MHLCQLQKNVVNNLIKNKLIISTCESATAGKIASSICDIPGASNVLKESYITYSNESKTKILGVDKNIIDTYGVVSKEIADEMAYNLHKITNADICVSITGNLGPDTLEDKPAGLVYIGIYFNNNTNVYECNFDGFRIEIKDKVVLKTFELLNDILENL